MSLLMISIIGSIASLLAMLAGFVWLGVRGQLEVRRMEPAEAADLVLKGWKGRPAWTWFRGLAAGVSLYAEKPTAEIIRLLMEGRWSEGLPWALPALGALAAFFFFPLFVGILLGLSDLMLWGMVAFFMVSALAAAWPRSAA